MLLETRPAATTAIIDLDDAGADRRPDPAEVLAAIRGLGPLDREALLLRFRDHADVTRIAATTGTTTAMVEVRVRRAARTVEAAVGPVLPGTGPTTTRSSVEVLEDARLGITPGLGARLDEALRHAADLRLASHGRVGRLRAGLCEVLRHRTQLGVLGSIGTLALCTAIGLAGTLP